MKTQRLWEASAPNGSDYVFPNTCHCTLVLDTAEPGEGQHSSCDAPAGVWTPHMMSITQSQFHLLHHGHTPTTEAKALSPPLWAVIKTRGAGGAWCGSKRTVLGDRELSVGEWWTHTQPGKWDSLIRHQLLHFTGRELFIDTASFIYFLTA